MNVLTIDQINILSKYLENKKKIVILGVGNPLKSDDGLGPFLCKKLSKLINTKDVLIIDGNIAPENYAGKITKFNPEVMFIIDAAILEGQDFGSFTVLNMNEIDGFGFSTHNFPLTMLINFIKMECSKCKVVFIGINPKILKFGNEFSEEIKNTIKCFINYFQSVLIT